MQAGLLLYQLSLHEKTISALAGQRLNKDELLGESSSTRYCAIYHNKYDGLLLTLSYLINPPSTSFWGPLAFQLVGDGGGDSTTKNTSTSGLS